MLNVAALSLLFLLGSKEGAVKLFDVEYFVVHDSCRLTYGEFFHYRELACRRNVERFPEKSHELGAISRGTSRSSSARAIRRLLGVED
ncbi:MAG: hypothetical protein IKE22_06205 [Atopobiaceae bacterium]|nr:hypothetical protein [Atopobiaceae bacterium]